MQASRARVPKRQGYHHGNLKEALVTAARRLIAERGPAGFSLVEAARLAGVSAAAPYRHFPDREALIAEVSRRGFEAFAARLEQAWSNGDAAPLEAFQRMGDAYLDFARSEPGFYAAMFMAKPGSSPPEGDRAFGGLEKAVSRIAGGAGQHAAAARALTYQVWAFSHGIATLAGAGRIPAAIAPEKLLRSGVEALIRGTFGATRPAATR